MPGRDGEVLTASRNAMRARIAKLAALIVSRSVMHYVQSCVRERSSDNIHKKRRRFVACAALHLRTGKLPIVELRQRRTRHSAVLHQHPFRAQAPSLLSVFMR